MKIIRTIKLSILPLTKRKEQLLVNLERQWLEACSHLFETLSNWDGFAPDLKQTRFNLQKLEYSHLRKTSGLQSQLVVDAIKDSYAAWHGTNGLVGCASPSFNIPRSGGFNKTEHGNPVATVAVNGTRVALPVRRDGAYQRFQGFLAGGWDTAHLRLKHNGDGWKLLVAISREHQINDGHDAVLGVDIGSRTLASVSVVKQGRVAKQLYLGRDVWNKQRDINIRRSRLRSLADKGDRKARKKLKELVGYESDFVKTRCYEIAHRVAELAREHNAVIAIEDLNKLNQSRLNRKGNRRVKRMPYRMFRVALETVAGRSNIGVVAVNPRHTSQRCSRCGSLHKTSGVLYYCPECGYTANRDRNASVNIAHAAGLIFCTTINAQGSMGDAPVNGHGWKHDGDAASCRRHGYSPDFKPLPSGRSS